MKKILLLILMITFSLSIPCFAQTAEDYYTTMIDNFAQAVKDKDEEAITLAWTQLNADPQAKEYMDVHYPVIAADFRLTQTVIESNQVLQKVQSTYPQPIQFPQRPQRPTFFKPLTNEDTVIARPNNLQPTNQEIQQRLLNAPPPDNQTTAANLPNQNRQSNQDFIQGRLNRLMQTTP
jgi:hypothetical protein